MLRKSPCNSQTDWTAAADSRVVSPRPETQLLAYEEWNSWFSWDRRLKERIHLCMCLCVTQYSCYLMAWWLEILYVEWDIAQFARVCTKIETWKHVLSAMSICTSVWVLLWLSICVFCLKGKHFDVNILALNPKGNLDDTFFPSTLNFQRDGLKSHTILRCQSLGKKVLQLIGHFYHN